MFDYTYVTKCVRFSTSDKTLIIEPLNNKGSVTGAEWILRSEDWVSDNRVSIGTDLSDLWADALAAFGNDYDWRGADGFYDNLVHFETVSRTLHLQEDFRWNLNLWTALIDRNGMLHTFPAVPGSGIDEVTLWYNADDVMDDYGTLTEALEQLGHHGPLAPALVGRLNHPAYATMC